MRSMSVGKSETEEIVAVISAVLLSGELGEAIAPSKGGTRSNWSISHRKMAFGKLLIAKLQIKQEL